MSASVGRLEPDAQEIAGFVHAMFRYADDGSFVSFRAFLQLQVGPPPYIRGSEINGAGLDGVINDAVAGARFAANYREPLVFAPPIATFRCEHKAAEADLINALGISVELDEGDTTKARQFLEHLLGPATCVAASGGEWVDPETGEVFAKLHLHWRLSEPTRTPDEHAQLKHARRLACAHLRRHGRQRGRARRVDRMVCEIQQVRGRHVRCEVEALCHIATIQDWIRHDRVLGEGGGLDAACPRAASPGRPRSVLLRPMGRARTANVPDRCPPASAQGLRRGPGHGHRRRPCRHCLGRHLGNQRCIGWQHPATDEAA